MIEFTTFITVNALKNNGHNIEVKTFNGVAASRGVQRFAEMGIHVVYVQRRCNRIT